MKFLKPVLDGQLLGMEIIKRSLLQNRITEEKKAT